MVLQSANRRVQSYQPGGSLTLVAGTRLGPYEITEPLGAGGMGVVYKAVDTRLNRPVALKAIHARLLERPDAARRLKKEALAVALLDHPYICKVYELIEHGPQSVLVMEFVEGETLAERLRQGPLPVDEALRYAAEIAEALVAAQAKGVTHRDIKPANVVVTAHGHVKLLDFGLARLPVAPDGTTVSTFGEGVAIGTVRYMAPEQVEGRDADIRADIFSLGVLLYECLGGRLPFEGRTLPAYVANLAAAPPPLGELRPEVTREVEHAVMRCLQLEPRKRFQSAGDLLATLNDLQTDTRTTGRPAVSRRQSVPWLVVVALVVVSAVAVWLIVSRIRGPAPARLESTRYAPLTTSGEEYDSRISPDGMLVSYVSGADVESRIWQKPIARPDAQPQVVTTPAGVILGHAWSPDSNDIAYLRSADGVVYLEIVPRSGGSEPTASWSTDMSSYSRVVRWTGTSIYVESSATLYRFDRFTGRREIVALPRSAELTGARDFAVDTDGAGVLFSSTSGHLYRHIWHVDLHTGKAQQLTNDTNANTHPIWFGKARRRLIYQSNAGGQTDLWWMNLPDRVPHRLTNGIGDEIPNDSTSDGSVLTYELDDERSRLFRLPANGTQATELTLQNVNEMWPTAAARSPAIAFLRAKAVRQLGWGFLDTEICLSPDGALMTDAPVIAAGWAPLISPDGLWVAFLRQPQDRANTTQLWLRDPRKQERLLSDRFVNPGVFSVPLEQATANLAWASDSSCLYAVESTGSGGESGRVVAYRTGDASSSTVVEESARIRDLYPSDDEKSLAYVRLGPSGAKGRPFALVVYDVASRARRVWSAGQLSRPSDSVRLAGWSPREARLIVLRVSRNDDLADRVDVLSVGADGAVRPIASLPRAHAATARINQRLNTLCILAAGPRENRLMEIALGTGAARQLQTTARRSVFFEALTFTSTGDMVFARREQTQNIYGIWFNDRR